MKLFITCYIILLALSVAFADICPQNQAGIINWSSWSGRPFASNQNVTVAAGQIILLDVAPPPIFMLNIYGTLVFSPTVSLELIANFIYVRTGGYLWVGSESCPITANVIITLVGGYNPTLNPDLVGSKVLGVFAGGNLDIHGVPRTPTWTVLNQNALSGDTQITLAQNVDWQIGEYIVLANTDFDPNVGQTPGFGVGTQSEVVKITSKPQSNVVGFSTPLQYPHYGKIWSSPNGDSIDMRGEVGLLTRNILIRGDINNITSPNAAAMHWGGHVIMRDGGSARIAYAEFVNGGQKDLIGRYPVHFHYTGNRQDSYVRGNSIHDTFQRCVTVHGTNNVRVQNNVAHNSYGHCYFLEDGNEEGNRFEHNLGVYTRPHTLIKSDGSPAMFWISNPNNHLYGNVAAGGNFGFWYSIGTHPWGLASNDIYNFLRFKPAGDFVNNKAHSVTWGLFVDKGQNDADGDLDFETAYTPVNFTTALQLNPSLNTSSMPNNYGSAIGIPVYAYFVNFIAYKCVDHGIWTMGSNQYVYGAKLADNAIAFQLIGASNMIANSLVVGETDNVGYTTSQNILFTYVNQEGRSRFNKGDLSSPIFGFMAYDGGGGLTFYNLTFVNFNNYKFSNGLVRPTGALTSGDGPNVPVANSKFFKLKFYNVDNPVYFSNRSLTNSVLGASIPDVDGSLTQGSGGSCGSVVVSSFSSVIRHPSCVAKPAWNAYLCPPGIPALRVLQIWGAGSQNPAKPFYLTKLSDRSNIQLNFFFFRQQFTIPVNQEYYLTYDTNNQMLASGGLVVDLMPGEWVRIAIPLPDVSMTMTKGYTTYTRVSTKSQLGSGKYFYDSGASIVWFHLEATSYGFNYYQGLPFRNGGDSVDWSASCGGSLCSYASTVTAPTGSPAPVAPYYDFCETAGGVSKGISSYTVKSSASYVIYNGTLQAPLQFDSTCVSSTSVVYNGSPSIVCTYTGTGGATGINRGFWYRSNLPSISAYSHLQLVVRAAPNFGAIDNTIYASNCSGNWLGYQVSLSSPFYTDDGQSVSDKRWTTVTIPISDIAKSDNFCGISLGNNIGRPVILYINSIKWVSLTQSLNAVSNYPNNFPVPSYVGPGSEFKY